MARIILSLNGNVLRDVALVKERIAIGRGPGNDIVLDNLAVSAEHAVIVTHENDSFLEDINSTNGTQVNGQPIKKHFLQDGDVIEIAQYRISFRSDPIPAIGSHGSSVAKVTVLDGPSAGKEISLVKALTTIGQPGVQTAAIAQRANGYYLMHIEGSIPLCLNGNAVGRNGHEILHGDVIDISGTRMKFSTQ